MKNDPAPKVMKVFQFLFTRIKKVLHSRMLAMAFLFLTPALAQVESSSRPKFASPTTKPRYHWIRKTELLTNRKNLPESDRLDVSISIFDTDLPDVEGSKEKSGVFSWVRKTDARIIPVQLMETMQASNYWGTVRVVPKEASSADIHVSGLIKQAHGLKQVLVIEVYDATGKRWFHKKFRQFCDLEKSMDLWFQPLYNRIANNILRARRSQSRKHLKTIPHVASLRFASEFAPLAFRDYLDTKYDGRSYRYRLIKLPSKDDPMIQRLAEIRARDQMFCDALSSSYQDYRARALPAYQLWQEASYDSEAAYSSNDGETQRGKRNNWFQWSTKKLADNLTYQIEPRLFELQGRTYELIGSAEVQYATWRKLLNEIFAEEAGLPGLNEETQVGKQ